MNPHKLRRAQLVDFGATAVTVLTAGGAGDVDPAIQTALSADLDPMVTELGTNEGATVDALAAYRAAVQAAELQRQLSLIGVQNLKNQLRAAGCAPEVFAALGYDAPIVTPVIYIPNDPSDCSATGYSNGIIRVVWAGNNPAGYVLYQVWRREGDDGEWSIIGTSGKQKYTDVGIIPGQYYEYKIRAMAARHFSNFSNSAVVYGV